MSKIVSINIINIINNKYYVLLLMFIVCMYNCITRIRRSAVVCKCVF